MDARFEGDEGDEGDEGGIAAAVPVLLVVGAVE